MTLEQESVSTSPQINNIFSSQAWLLLEIDSQHATYLEMTEGSLAASPFLDHRVAGAPEAKKYRVDIGAVLRSTAWQTAAPPYPTRYILHISHVGSTLISRALGVAPTCLSLREPLPLRYLAARYPELGHPESWLSSQAFQQLADFTLRSLGRPLNGRADVVVKCTSWVNALAPLFLDPQFGGRKQVVGVYSTLDNFVSNTLKGSGGRADLTSVAQARIRRLGEILPEAEIHLHALNDGEIAAMTWLCEMLSIHRACAQHGSDLHWLDFDAFLQRPVEQSAALAQHMKLHWPAETNVTLQTSGVLTNYAKRAESIEFSGKEREAILSKFKGEHPGQITAANTWLDKQFKRNPELFSVLGSFR